MLLGTAFVAMKFANEEENRIHVQCRPTYSCIWEDSKFDPTDEDANDTIIIFTNSKQLSKCTDMEMNVGIQDTKS